MIELSDKEQLDMLYIKRNQWWIEKGRIDTKINALESKIRRK